MSKYQLGFILFFVSVGVLGVLVFAGIIDLPGEDNNPVSQEAVTLTMWGTLDSNEVGGVFTRFNEAYRDRYRISYIQKNKESLELDFLRAVSAGQVPDIILFPHDLLVSLEEQLYTIPETSLTKRQYRELFIEGTEIYIKSDGVAALPILADPLVMYWNRDLFNNERITEVPRTWDDVLTTARLLTKKDNRQKILQSAIALGESRNINHFKDVISLLFIQTGDFIIQRAEEGGLELLFGSSALATEKELIPAESALAFYTGFADAKLSHYSWNASFSSSLDAFVSGDLAMYFGPASDLERIKERNPHLNFDVAPVPQLSGTPRDLTYARFYALGVSKLSPNVGRALDALFLLTISDNDNQRAFSSRLSLPPVKRILVTEGSTDPFVSVFYNEAAIARTWIDPNPQETERVFANMVNSIVSNATQESQAVTNAQTQLRDLLK